MSDEKDRINSLLGSDFYHKYSWISKKKPQWHPSEYSRLISIMGNAADDLAGKFPPWWNFLAPNSDVDRKNWSLTIDGFIYVSVTRALRGNGVNFLNRDSILDICPICSCVMNHKYLVFMKYIIWNEEYSPADIIDWQTSFQKACYIHWRAILSEETRDRNLETWKLSTKETNLSSKPRLLFPPPLLDQLFFLLNTSNFNFIVYFDLSLQ